VRVDLVHLREFHIQKSCERFSVRLVPNFNRHLSENTRKGMPSSDSMSLSISSSESMGSERSRSRQVDEEGTSSRGMVSGIPMETVREV